MRVKEKTTLEFDELKDILRIVELNRELVVKMSNLLEATRKRNSEMKGILGIANQLTLLLQRYRTKDVKALIGKDLTDEEKVSLNSIFQQKHINLKFEAKKVKGVLTKIKEEK